jgi:GTP pyrophosphokinase
MTVHAKRSRSVKETAHQTPDSLIGRAYAFALKAHAGQKRKTGEPYFNHVLATAETLAKWRLDETAIAAGLLHDVVEDTPVTRAELVKEFGEDIAFLVDGVTKLSHVKYRGAEAKIENLRKMIVALSEDLRVIFVKLADRLHNMQTLDALPPQKQKRIALETAEIYAPIAARLGMHELAGTLQDLAFPYLHPKEEQWLKNEVSEEYGVRRNYLETVKPHLEGIVQNAGINILQLDFRAKHYYSLYKKLLRYDMDLGRIYDLVAIRLILSSVEHCYAALGAIHQHWHPLPGRIKDYIAMPKANNYRSLHTTVIGPDGKYIEIQLRTKEMHEENEYGIAAHWLYKERQAAPRALAETKKWVGQLKDWQAKYRSAEDDPAEFLGAMKVEFFKDRVFAITPRGDVIDLPSSATPVDFAYHIHSQIGNAAVGAKVNGQLVPLNHELQSGDIVDILTQKNKEPSEDWLTFVKSSAARDHIRSALSAKRRAVGGKREPARTEFKLIVEDRLGMIKDITTVIARSHANIVSFETANTPKNKLPVDRVIVSTTDKDKMEKLAVKLRRIPGVREVHWQLIS